MAENNPSLQTLTNSNTSRTPSEQTDTDESQSDMALELIETLKNSSTKHTEQTNTDENQSDMALELNKTLKNSSTKHTEQTNTDETQSGMALELERETTSLDEDQAGSLKKDVVTALANNQQNLINRTLNENFSLINRNTKEQINLIHTHDSDSYDANDETKAKMKGSKSDGFIERDIKKYFMDTKSHVSENVYFEKSLYSSILDLVEARIVEIAAEYDENKPVCRICHGSTEDLQLMCLCRGTMGSVHSACLTRWLTESGRSRCEICNHRYSVRRTLKRPLRETLAGWLLEVVRSNQVFIILSWLMAITPLILLAATLCVFCLRQIFLYSERARIVHPALAFFSFTCSLTLVVWYYDMLFMIARAYLENWHLYYIRDHEIEIVSYNRPIAQESFL